MSKNITVTSKDLELLNSNSGLLNLLRPKKPDIQKALNYVNYEHKLLSLQSELIAMQQWVTENNKRVIIIAEGRDLAGKGGAIRRMSQHLNPRKYRIEALSKPTETEKMQWYFKRYIAKLPNPGEIVFFNRSWYNRAVVEPVNDFCTPSEYTRFIEEVVQFEKMLCNDGVILIKLYFSISKKEQKSRLTKTKKNPLKQWKLSPLDEKAQPLWDKYTKYEKQMLLNTHLEDSPWNVIKTDKKTEARVESIETILSIIPYKT